MKQFILLSIFLAISMATFAQIQVKHHPKTNIQHKKSMEAKKEITPTVDTTTVAPIVATTEVTTLGAGCFWCVEAVFQRLNGVTKVTSGYAGGKVVNPSYKDVCTGLTGHAEVCQVTFDPTKISFEEILEVYWKVHDPTTLNRQGNDVGPQYRSVIFYQNAHQKEIAENIKHKLNDSEAFAHPVITAIEPYSTFYAAEDYHKDYFNLNGTQPYCQFVVRPKVEKFEKVFKNKLKKEM